VPALIDQTNLAIPKFEKGDAGIIFKANGELVVWNTFENPSEPNDAERETGKMLMAFVAAHKLPQIMDILHKIALDSTVFTQAVDVGTRQ